MEEVFDPLGCYVQRCVLGGLEIDDIIDSHQVEQANGDIRTVYRSVRNSHNREIVFETPLAITTVQNYNDFLYPAGAVDVSAKPRGHTIKLMQYGVRPVEYCLVGVTFEDSMYLFGDQESPEYKSVGSLGGIREAHIEEIVDIFLEGFVEEGETVEEVRQVK